MKGSVLVLLGCFALFFAAPSHSYSVSEDDQLANRRDPRSGSPSADAATSGDAGESETVKMDGDANPGHDQAEKSKIRKRDTRGLSSGGMKLIETTVPHVDKSFALMLFRKLGKYGGHCLEQAFNLIELHEMPIGPAESWYSEALLTRTDMVKWLKILKDSVSECLTNYVDEMIKESLPLEYTDPSEIFVNVPELLSPLAEIAKTLKKCLEDAIAYLETTSNHPGNAARRSSESLSDLLTELVEILSVIDGGVVPAGDTVPMTPPGHHAPPYLDSVPVITAYKKRNSPVKPGRRGRYTTLPGSIQSQYIHSRDISDSIVPQVPGFGGEAVGVPHAPVITTLPGDVNPLPTQQLSLLDIVLDQIYSKLQGKASPAVNMEAAPVEGLRVDANGALGTYPGNGRSPAAGNLAYYPECVNKRVQ